MGKLKSNIERGRRIVDARKKLRMTQEQLAERVTTFKRAQKKDATAVSRGAIGNWEQGLGLTTENLNCLAEVLGTSAQWILTGELNHEISLSKATVTSLVLPVIGKVQAGVWEEIDLVDQSEFADTHLMVPLDPRFSAENQYLLKIVGDSVNEFAKSGSYAHCVDTASGLEVTNGHMVVVERVRAQGAEIERTIKEFRIVNGRKELWQRSTNPKHNGPLPLGNDENTEIRVRAIVINFINPAPGFL